MKYSRAPSDEELSDASSEPGRCEMLRSRMPKWGCCAWFGITVLFLVLTSELIAWLRQPTCNSASDFIWNEVIPPNTVSQIDREGLRHLWQQIDVLGLATKLWHFNVWMNSTSAVSASDSLGYWSDGHLLFGLVEKIAFVDQQGRTSLEGHKVGGPFGSNFQVWLCSSSHRATSYELSVETQPWSLSKPGLTVVYNIHEMPSGGEGTLVAKAHFDLKTMNFYSHKSHWEALVETPDEKELIGSVTQNTSSFNSKWFVANQRPDLLPNEVLSFLALVYDIDETRQS
ncbi:unnamed protein product [Durusdinium trenchii]|uniref:Uncharacterized protein n=2 Tax=Durusdinium trenchii TaxID=1381693 RepID=A0ABP0J6B9_9DINO